MLRILPPRQRIATQSLVVGSDSVADENLFLTTFSKDKQRLMRLPLGNQTERTNIVGKDQGEFSLLGRGWRREKILVR